MDKTLDARNVSDLEKALSSLMNQQNINDNNQLNQSNESNQINPYLYQSNQQPVQSFEPPNQYYDVFNKSQQPIKASSSKARTNAQSNSTAGLLTNLNGLQTINNTKIDLLNDSIMRLTNVMEQVVKNQEKQLDVLASISKNTMKLHIPSHSPIPHSPSGQKPSGNSVKEFNFTSATDVMSTLIITLLSLMKREIMKKSKNYMSSRDITPSTLNTAIKVLIKSQVKMDRVMYEPLSMPSSKNPALIQIASRIGTIHGITPMMTPIAFRDLINDPECNSFITLMQDIIERLKIIRVLIPYYEADILEAIEFPYFDRDGQILCDFDKLNPRRESHEETRVQDAPTKKREDVGVMIARGVSVKAAINAILKEK